MNENLLSLLFQRNYLKVTGSNSFHTTKTKTGSYSVQEDLRFRGSVFFARFKVNHRSIYSRISARMCAVAMAMGLVKNKAQKMAFCLFEKHPVIRFLSNFAHYEFT